TQDTSVYQYESALRLAHGQSPIGAFLVNLTRLAQAVAETSPKDPSYTRNFDRSCSEVVSGTRYPPLGHKMERDTKRVLKGLVLTGLVGGLCSFGSAATMTMTGMISDSACGTSHAKMMDMHKGAKMTE